MCSKEKFDNKATVTPAMIENEACCSCKIGIENMVIANAQFNEALKSVDNYYEEVCEYVFSGEGGYYEYYKFWHRYSKEVDIIRDMIDQGKTISEIKKYYFRGR